MRSDWKGDKAIKTTKEDIDFFNEFVIAAETQIQIEIVKPNHFTNGWYNDRIGEVFKVTRLHHGIPNQYEVDLTELFEKGEETVKLGFVPFCDAKIAE